MLSTTEFIGDFPVDDMELFVNKYGSFTREFYICYEVVFLLLCELSFSRNPDFPYLSYARFQLDYLNDSECMAEFRFYRNDIYRVN